MKKHMITDRRPDLGHWKSSLSEMWTIHDDSLDNFYCLKSPLVKKISLCLQIPFSVGCTVGFNIQNMSENKLLSEVVESPIIKRKLDFILEFVVKKLKQY